MLSPEFRDFYSTWIRKAEESSTQELRQCFDKFFTLFVIYNRLYAETTFLLVRKGIITLERRRNTFPDSRAAKDYVRRYLGNSDFVHQIEEDPCTNQALNTICRLIQDEIFYIKLDIMTGNRQREADLKLLDSLRSTNEHVKARAVLDFVYSIRCNMFHGHKGFNEIQVEILRPAIIILRKIVNLLYDKISNDDD